MAAYTSIMSDMSKEDKLAVVTFLLSTLNGNDDRTLFYSYFEKWKEDTKFLSSVAAITSHDSFKAIVDMGGNAVPYILEEIERKPSNLVWALNAIFHNKIGKGNTVSEACKLWIAELKKS